MAQHPFWFALTWACVVWYTTVTVYVAIRGGSDVRSMLRRLEAGNETPPDAPNST